MDNNSRLNKHKRNHKLELLLKELSEILTPCELELIMDMKNLSYPIVLIVGCARSGTTLLYQYLAQSGSFCYPTNLMSRFYYAPYIGAKINQLLVNLDYNGEILGGGLVSNYISSLGKTKGANSPHEFWYFWRRFFPFGDKDQLSRDQLANVDRVTFLKELASIQQVFQKTLLMKGLIMNWHIPYLASLSEKIFFIYIKRNIAFNAQSLLMARKEYFGTFDKWYSFKPIEYDSFSESSNEEQVVKQVFFTNQAIEKGLSELDSSRYLVVDYNSFCDNPANIFSEVGFLNEIGGAKFSSSFKISNKIRVTKDTWRKNFNTHK